MLLPIHDMEPIIPPFTSCAATGSKGLFSCASFYGRDTDCYRVEGREEIRKDFRKSLFVVYPAVDKDGYMVYYTHWQDNIGFTSPMGTYLKYDEADDSNSRNTYWRLSLDSLC